MTRAARWTLLTREGCGLCEDFSAELDVLFGDRLDAEPVLVDEYPEWRAAYGLSIPVLLDANGAFVCAVRVDETAVDWRLRDESA